MKNKWSLVVRLMVWINLASVLIIIALSVNSAMDAMDKTELLVKTNVHALANTIKLTSSEYVKNLNIDGLKNIAHKLLEDPSIEAVIFTDDKNTELAKAEEKDVANPNHESVELTKLPIIYGPDNHVIGNVEIKYNFDEVKVLKKELITKAIIGVVAAQIILLIVIWLLLRSTTKNLGNIASKLRIVSGETQKTSDSVRAISEEVSSATTEQAASIQETVSTLDQITSMVNTSVESVENSARKAEQSHIIANEGKEVVKDMIRSMEDIDNSNKDIMTEISKSNERIASIIKVINEISQKTTVINDIVFQTKLLSFNASVEAARAGEHGKGFAVVAEEVGNLAQMSGKASNEISEMLQESINKVNAIIQETNQNVQRLINSGNEKVQAGVKIAGKCGKVLDEVVDNAAVVKTMMNEVSVASKEQAEGVKNISIAMNQLDQTTHSNANAANRSFQNSKELSTQADNLKDTVEILEVEIFGRKGHKLSLVEDPKHSVKNNVIPLKRETKPKTTMKNQTAPNEINKAMGAVQNIKSSRSKDPTETKDSHVTHPNDSSSASSKGKSNLVVPSHNDPRFEDV